jgi:hypothetical protein
MYQKSMSIAFSLGSRSYNSVEGVRLGVDAQTSREARNMLKHWRILEPAIGLEPMTC